MSRWHAQLGQNPARQHEPRNEDERESDPLVHIHADSTVVWRLAANFCR